MGPHFQGARQRCLFGDQSSLEYHERAKIRKSYQHFECCRLVRRLRIGELLRRKTLLTRFHSSLGQRGREEQHQSQHDLPYRRFKNDRDSLAKSCFGLVKTTLHRAFGLVSQPRFVRGIWLCLRGLLIVFKIRSEPVGSQN